MTASVSPRLLRAIELIRVDLPRGCVAVDGVHDAVTDDDVVSVLADAVYARLHVGHPRAASIPADAPGADDITPLLDLDLGDRFGEGMLILPADEDGRAVVALDGMRVEVDAHRVDDPVGAIGSAVRVRMPRVAPRLSPGYIAALGGRAGPPPDHRWYLAIRTPEEAVAAWSRVVAELDAWGGQHQVKVVRRTELLPRNDGLVVYARHDPSLTGRLARVADELSLAPLPRSSPFTNPVRAGLADSAAPDDRRPGRADLSFGQHRSRALAEGVVDAARGGGDRLDHVLHAFARANVLAADPSRNRADAGAPHPAGDPRASRPGPGRDLRDHGEEETHEQARPDRR